MTIIIMMMIIKECQEYRVLGASEDVTTAGCSYLRLKPTLPSPIHTLQTLPYPVHTLPTP